MKTPKPLTSFHLRLLALISMFFDHFAVTLLADLLNGTHAVTNAMRASSNLRDIILVWCSRNEGLLWSCYDWMRWMGRLAFPLYCFLIVQGFLYTRSRLKYAGRLALLAVISEIPFDLALMDSVLEFRSNNVFFTLLAGLLLIWGISRLETLCAKIGRRWLSWTALAGGGILLFAAAYWTMEHVLHSDYGISGLAAILLMYLLRRYPLPAVAAGCAATVVLNLSMTQLFSFAALIPAALYGGGKGRSMKVFFYGFYPLHLLLLVLAQVLLNV